MAALLRFAASVSLRWYSTPCLTDKTGCRGLLDTHARNSSGRNRIFVDLRSSTHLRHISWLHRTRFWRQADRRLRPASGTVSRSPVRRLFRNPTAALQRSIAFDVMFGAAGGPVCAVAMAQSGSHIHTTALDTPPRSQATTRHTLPKSAYLTYFDISTASLPLCIAAYSVPTSGSRS